MKQLLLSLVISLMLRLTLGDDIYQKFLVQLQQFTNDQLGITKFQQFIDDQKNTQLGFVNSAPDGTSLVDKISGDIDDVVQNYIAAVRRIQTAYNNGQQTEQIRLDFCCNLQNLKYDPRFKRLIDDNNVCHFTTLDMSINLAVKNAMIQNLKALPNIKWQFYGTEDGRHCTYPARNLCNESADFDPRTRAWYTGAVNSPRDIVILIDRSSSMGDPYDNGNTNPTKINVAKNAAAAIVSYLNANDRVAVLAFSDTVIATNSNGCFAKELAVATSDNQKQLLSFLQGELFPDPSEKRAKFETAFRTAYQVFKTTESNTTSGLYADSEKIIVLLTDMNQVENCDQISQLETELFNNTVDIFTMGIGENLKSDTQKTSCLENLAAGRRGAYGYVPKNEIKNLRGELAFFYNAFTDQIDHVNVTFSVPFTDVNGLGLHTAVCLPLFNTQNQLDGVACVEIDVSDIFEEIVNFRLGKQSYGFVLDKRGRVILHPLLPPPTSWLTQPTLLELTKVEISTYTSDIEKQILSGVPGNRTVRIKSFTPIGQSGLHGVTKYDLTATYFWHAIPTMRFFLCLVIVQNEMKSGLTWNSSFSDVFLSDELDINSNGKCVYFNRLSTLAYKSAVKLAPMAFQYAMNYTERDVTSNDIFQLKTFITWKGAQAQNLTIKNGIRDVVAATSFLEGLWSSNASSVDKQHILSRYIGTKEGVFRGYPPVRLDKEYDPTLQPWYKTANAQAGLLSFTLPFKDIVTGVPITSISKTVWNGNTQSHSISDPIMGVMGMDVTVKHLYSLLTSNIDQCKINGQECFAIDLSGFVILHKDFSINIPNGSLHIAAREPLIASELMQNRILTADTCVSYVELPLMRQLFWKTDVSFSNCQQLTSSTICKMKIQNPDIATNLFLVVKLQRSGTGANCSCESQADGSSRCTYDLTSTNLCQCPCRLPVDYDSCLANLNIDPVTWKPCIPNGTPMNPEDLTLSRRDLLSGLQSCFPCTTYTDEQLSEANSCSSPATSTQNVTATATSLTLSVADTSSRSLTLGLAIGLSLGIVFLASVIAAVLLVCLCHKRKSAPPIKTYNDIYESAPTGDYVTTVVVGGDDSLQNKDKFVTLTGNQVENEIHPQQNSMSITSIV